MTHAPPRLVNTAPRLVLAVVVLSLLAFSVASLFAAPTQFPTITVEYLQTDSARAIARWVKPCDGKGCADGYTVKWTAGSATRNVTTTALADTFRVKRPAYGDSLLATVTVTAVRRTNTSPARTANAWIRNPDAAPPPVDSLKVDTIPRADSTRLVAFSSRGDSLGVPLVTEHDSLLLVQRKWFRPGTVRRDHTTWDVSSLTSVVRVRAIDARGDSVWLVALSCNCAESGNPTNPPRLDVRNGSYAVRNAAGAWTPVRPLAADPFTR
jgi:hypothetical protein